jgi:hypothetical protein
VGRQTLHSFANGGVTENKKENDKLWKDFENRVLA